MQRCRSALGVAVIGALVLVGCGSSDDGDGDAGTGDDVDVETVTGGTDVAASDTDADTVGADEPADETPATDPPATDASTTSVAPTKTAVLHVDSTVGFLPFLLPLLPTLETDPGPDGAGRPTFSWESIEGAVDYTVIVAVEAQAHWAVTTDATSATVGDGLDPFAVGPRVDDTMRWYVYARDASGEPIAQSVGQPIPPIG